MNQLLFGTMRWYPSNKKKSGVKNAGKSTKKSTLKPRGGYLNLNNKTFPKSTWFQYEKTSEFKGTIV